MSWLRKPGKVSLLLLAVAVLVVLLLAWKPLLSAHSSKAPHKGAGAVPVAVAKVQQTDIPILLSGLGTVTSTYTVTVRSRVDGQLDKVHFVEGRQVYEGQLLAELDPRPYAAQLMQAEGQLLRDQALLQAATLDLARYRQLLEQNSIARQQVDTQTALVKQYQGTVKLDQGVVDNARLQLRYSRIVAPISGRVGLRQVDPGNIVHAADTNGLVTITQVRPITAVFSLPETALPAILRTEQATNGALRVEAWDQDSHSQLATGTLLAIDNQVNTATGTVNLKATFPNQDARLFPNQFVNIRLRLGTRQQAIVVPSEAIQIGRGGSYVYSVEPAHTVKLRKVVVGPVSDKVTIIESGLQAGETVVIDGLDKLRDGATIQVAQRQAAGSDGGGPRSARSGQPPSQHGTAHNLKNSS